MNKLKKCKKIKNWIILNKGFNVPVQIESHLSNCSDCKNFYNEENLLIKISKINNIKEEVSLNLDLKVKRSIIDISEKLSKRRTKKRFGLLPKILAPISLCFLIISFLYLPIYKGENYFGNKINKDFNNSLSIQSSQDLKEVGLVPENNNISDSIGDLRFINALFDTDNDKNFYYTYNNLTRDKLFLIKFLAEKSSKNILDIYDLLLSKNYAYVLRMLKLPYQNTLNEFNEYKSNYLEKFNKDFTSIDCVVTSIDYFNSQITIDSLLSPIKIDQLITDFPTPGDYINLDFIQDGDSLICKDFRKAEYSTTIINGKINKIDNNSIILSNFSNQINITRKTII